jgi:hypothetical protein
LLAVLCLVSPQRQLAAQEEQEPLTPDSGWAIDRWNVRFSFYTTHFDSDPDHVNNQKLLGSEVVFANDYLAGLALFDNSFGQSSQFLYFGKYWSLTAADSWYFKLMGGLLNGYDEPYDDKIPFNGLGVAPAIVPALGYRYRRVFVEANLAGLAALTLTAGMRF